MSEYCSKRSQCFLGEFLYRDTFFYVQCNFAMTASNCQSDDGYKKQIKNDRRSAAGNGSVSCKTLKSYLFIALFSCTFSPVHSIISSVYSITGRIACLDGQLYEACPTPPSLSFVHYSFPSTFMAYRFVHMTQCSTCKM